MITLGLNDVNEKATGLVFEVITYCKEKGIELPSMVARTHIYQRAKKLKHSYGISLQEFDRLQILQNNLCAICKQSQRGNHRWGTSLYLTVDHCHKTGKIRGLLCTDCNHALGRFKENIDILKNAIRYLEAQKGDPK